MYLQDTSQKPYSSLVSPTRVPLCLCFCISSNIFRVWLQWHSSCQASQTSVVYSPRLWPSASAYLIAFAILCCICTVLVGIQKESYGIIIYRTTDNVHLQSPLCPNMCWKRVGKSPQQKDIMQISFSAKRTQCANYSTTFFVYNMHTHPKRLREYLILLLHCQGTRGLKPLVCAHVIIWFPPTTTSIESNGLAAPTAVYCIPDAHIYVLPGHVAVTTATNGASKNNKVMIVSYLLTGSWYIILTVYHGHWIAITLQSCHSPSTPPAVQRSHTPP